MGSLGNDSQTDLTNTVVIIQHSDRVPLAYLDHFLNPPSHTIPHTVITIYNGQQLPKTTQIYALIVLGGPQGAYEADIFSYLNDEVKYIQQCHQANVPILGLCLGCQLVALAFGATVYKAQTYEVGYVDQVATEAALSDPIFAPLFNTADHTNNSLLMHHQDTYTIPESAVVLATTCKLGYNAAFRIGSRTYAVQSHPESGINELKQWRLFAEHNYTSVGLTADDVMQEAVSKKDAALKTTETFFERWWMFVQQCHAQ